MKTVGGGGRLFTNTENQDFKFPDFLSPIVDTTIGTSFCSSPKYYSMGVVPIKVNFFKIDEIFEMSVSYIDKTVESNKKEIPINENDLTTKSIKNHYLLTKGALGEFAPTKVILSLTILNIIKRLLNIIKLKSAEKFEYLPTSLAMGMYPLTSIDLDLINFPEEKHFKQQLNQKDYKNGFVGRIFYFLRVPENSIYKFCMTSSGAAGLYLYSFDEILSNNLYNEEEKTICGSLNMVSGKYIFI